jgi:hypothetical protein
MIFRVTGLTAAIQPILNACPGNAIREGTTDMGPWQERLPALMKSPVVMTPERLLRANIGGSPLGGTRKP